jgi:hypothetical protein
MARHHTVWILDVADAQKVTKDTTGRWRVPLRAISGGKQNFKCFIRSFCYTQ